jgi:hypothetical protein
VSRSVLQRIHNPRSRECGCDPDCWCRRTAFGRAVKWWVPPRLAPHTSEATAERKRDRDQDAWASGHDEQQHQREHQKDRAPVEQLDPGHHPEAREHP